MVLDALEEGGMIDQEQLLKELDKKSYDELKQVHSSFEKMLQELARKSWLTPEEEYKEKQLKKLKLMVKDRMAALKKKAASGGAGGA